MCAYAVKGKTIIRYPNGIISINITELYYVLKMKSPVWFRYCAAITDVILVCLLLCIHATVLKCG